MIVDYCRENKIAIQFDSPEERDAVNELFGRTDKFDVTEGILSHYQTETETRSSNGLIVTTVSLYRSSTQKHTFDGFTIITAKEFLELSDERQTIVVT